eukprot:c22138_g1_i2 orf=658-1167(-)
MTQKMHASNLLQTVLKSRKRSTSGMHSVSSSRRNRTVVNDPCPAPQMCLCSPTTHPGSFRCRLHRAPLDQRDRLSPAPEEAKATVANDPSNLTTIGTPVMPNNKMKMPPIGKDVRRHSLPSTLNPSNRSISRKLETRPSRLSRVIVAEDPDFEKYVAIFVSFFQSNQFM